MAQYGPETPSTFGVTLPVDQIDKVRNNLSKINKPYFSPKQLNFSANWKL